jgi:FkbM family methyltransferase
MNSPVLSSRRLLRQIILAPLYGLNFLGTTFSHFLGLLRPSLKQVWNDIHLIRIQNHIASVTHTKKNGGHVHLSLFTPNVLCEYRAESFSSKEPETLEWIDEFGGEGAFFDIGANVGLYSIYHGKTKSGRIYAFEPSVFNLSLLAKNISINGLSDKIHIIANPLTNKNSFADFNLQSTVEGGALSTFGADYGQDGKPLRKVFSYKTCGFSLDYLISHGIISDRPRLIKLDVDGIEHLILDGAKETISDPNCKSILIEIHEAFTSSTQKVNEILTQAGFTMIRKGPGESYNQIWIKK